MKIMVLTGYFEAYTNSDLTEGRGGDVHIGYFRYEDDAKKAVKGRGVWGTDASVRMVQDKTIRVFESYEEFTTVQTSDLKTKALNKLTVEEKKALGLL